MHPSTRRWLTGSALLVLAIVVGIFAVTRSVEVVKLLASVVTGLLACWFVVLYDSSARIRFSFDHPGETLHGPDMGQFVAVYQQYAYAIPILGLLMGSFIIWRWSKSKFLIELVVQVLWILAFMWAGLVLILWQVQNIPMFTAMHWHY